MCPWFDSRWHHFEARELLKSNSLFLCLKTVKIQGKTEFNASAVARRMGLSQSLFAQYICGAKKPSEKRYREILETIHDIGKELASINDMSGKVEYALSV